MNSYVQKCLFLVFVFAAGIAATSEDVLAQDFDLECTDGYGHAGFADVSAAVDHALNDAGVPYYDGYVNWDGAGEITYSFSTSEFSYYYVNLTGIRTSNDTREEVGWSTVQCYAFLACSIDDPSISGSVSGVSPDAGPLNETVACQDNCSYSTSAPVNSVCNFSDDNNDGVLSSGESYSCPRTYTATGTTCNTGDGVNDGVSPVGSGDAGIPTYDCTNTDCSSPGIPIDGGGAPPGSSNDSGGTDSDDTGGNSGTGDGDPDTPGTGDGTGDGDIDGDGDRDIDCNPLSNPDCAFSGSGSASSICGVAPTCSGDPVQCAILYQNYNTMCAILTSAENEKKDEEAQSAQASNDCDTPPVCDGDPVQCTIIRQMWENQCNLIDTGSETPLSDDPDYGRDLAGEGEGTEVDISSGLDEAGLGTGTCPAPIAINTTWANFTIDTAPLCSIAGWVRVFVILFTLLWAGPYVVRSF